MVGAHTKVPPIIVFIQYLSQVHGAQTNHHINLIYPGESAKDAVTLTEEECDRLVEKVRRRPCNPMRQRLSPCVVEAVTVCGRGCGRVCWGGGDY